MLNNIKDEKSQEQLGKKHGYLKKDYLDSDLVSVYTFRKSDKDYSFNSYESKITKLGIQDEDMNQIASDLYDESYDIKDLLMM